MRWRNLILRNYQAVLVIIFFDEDELFNTRSRQHQIRAPVEFDSVETEALIEALRTQGVPTQHIRVLRELYTIKISPFYNDVVVNVKSRVRQVDAISPKVVRTTLENVMCEPEWEDMGVNVHGPAVASILAALTTS